MSRDFAAEMRAVMDAETAGGPYAAPVVAAHIVEKLRATDPELLTGWLDQQAVGIVRHAINLRDCSVRTHNRAVASRSMFAAAVGKFVEGDDVPLRTNFSGEVYLTEDGTKVSLREMRQPDLLFAADDFAARAKENAMREAFLRALARKVGRRKVGDVFDEEKLVRLWQSIAGAE